MPPLGSFQTFGSALRSAAGNIRPGSGPRTRSIGGRTRAKAGGPGTTVGPVRGSTAAASRAKGIAATGDRGHYGGKGSAIKGK